LRPSSPKRCGTKRCACCSSRLFDRANIRRYNNDPLSPALETFERSGNPGTRLVLQDGALVYGMPREVYFGTRLRF
jgi:hypothetical protein